MSRTHKDQQRHGHAPKPDRRITVRGVRREPMDYRKLARALIAIAQAETEAQATTSAQVSNPSQAVDRKSAPPPEAA